MDFNLTDEQRLIEESARKFADAYDPRHGREGVDRRHWQKLAELGFLTLGLPEEYGGIGGAAEIAITCQAFGRGPVLEPYVSTVLFAAQIVAHAGGDGHKEKILPAIAAGQSIVSVAYREPDDPGSQDKPRTTARREGGEYILDGHKCLVLGAPVADLLIVPAPIEGAGAVSLVLVDPRLPGVRVTPVPLVDGSLCAQVEFKDVRVSTHNLLGSEGGGAASLREGLRYATLGVCAEMAGLCAQALDVTAAYLKMRQQFGAPLSSFQALRHKIADMAIDGEMARAAMFKLVASFQAPDRHDAAMTAALAKATLDDITFRVCAQAIQLHGAMGLTEECGVGRFFARATVIRSLYGSTERHVRDYARLLRDELTSKSL